MDIQLINIVTSVIESLVLEIGKGLWIRTQSVRKDKKRKEAIKEHVIKALHNDHKSMLESSSLCEFLSSPQIREVINGYTYYMVSGNATEYFAKNILDKGTTQIDETTVVKYLSGNYLSQCTAMLLKPTTIETENFFHKLLKEIFDFVYAELDEKDLMIITSVNNRIDHGNSIVLKAMNDLGKLLDRLLISQFTPNIHEYHNVKDLYMRLLTANFAKAHIYLLDYFDFNAFYVPPSLNRICMPLFSSDFIELESAKQIAFANALEKIDSHWMHIFNNRNIVYVTGGAGYGKSLFLRNIVNNYRKLNLLDSDDYIVIFGELKSFFKNGNTSPCSVIEFLHDSMKQNTLLDESLLTKEFIQYYLDRGRCLILLDALDEVEKENRKILHTKIVSFFEKAYPSNRVCITSRNRGFIPSEGIEVFDIRPLHPSQIEKYVDNIIKLRKFDAVDKAAFLRQTEKLIEKRFLNSFLVLSLLINIYKAERELPENKLELYQKCFEYIANKREKEKSEQYDWKLLVPLMKDNTFMELSRLCFPNNKDVDSNTIKNALFDIYKNKYASECEAENAINDFLVFCSDRTELFVLSGKEDHFKFFHRSFFEYFYSKYLFLRCQTAEEICMCLKQFDVDSEVFELTVAMLKQSAEEKYKKLIEILLYETLEDIKGSTPTFLTFNILVLAMQVVDDITYRNEFISLLSLNSDLIYRCRSKIKNQDLLADMIIGNEDYVNVIMDKYKSLAIIQILLSFSKYGIHIIQFHEINGDADIFDLFELVNDRLLFPTDEPIWFYSLVVLKNKEILLSIFDIETSDLITILNKRNIGKRKKAEIIEMFDSLNAFKNRTKKVNDLTIA